MFQIKIVEKTKIHILCSVTYFRKSCRSCVNVEKYGGAREAADGNTAVHCILVTRAQAHASARAPTPTPTPPSTNVHARTRTHTEICETYCFYTAKAVSCTDLNVTLYKVVQI